MTAVLSLLTFSSASNLRGLVSATLLTLLVLPVMFKVLHAKRKSMVTLARLVKIVLKQTQTLMFTHHMCVGAVRAGDCLNASCHLQHFTLHVHIISFFAKDERI